MASPNLTQERIAAGLKEVRDGVTVDWKGASLPAALVGAAILEASKLDAPRPLTLLNLHVLGDIELDGIGDTGTPLRLQIFGCHIDGALRARSSHWRQLFIAHGRLRTIDLPGSTFDSDLVIEFVQCGGSLELRSCVIERRLVLNGSSFALKDRDGAIMLSDARIGVAMEARDLDTTGGLLARAIQIGGDLRLDGAVLDCSADNGPRALDLSRAQISGHLRLGPTDKGCFTARGRVHLDGAEIGQLDCKGASLDGLGDPALIADQAKIAHTVDLSGFAEEEAPKFEANGAIRFMAATIGRQFQMFDASVAAPNDALVLGGAQIGGDLLLGNEGVATRFTGAIRGDALCVGGRIIMHGIHVNGSRAAISITHAQVASDVLFYEIEADTPIFLDGLHADGLTFEHLTLRQEQPVITSDGLPEHYAHPEDALLGLNFIHLSSDLRLENVALDGGDMRLIGAKIERGIQANRLTIRNTRSAALIAQGAEIGTGFQIAGTPEVSAIFDGAFHMMGLAVKGECTFVHLSIGSDSKPADFVLRNARIDIGLTFLHCTIHGELNASSARVDGDFHIHSSRLSNPGAVACDVRGASVTGKLQWATVTRAEPINCWVAGQITADNAQVGVLGWHRVHLAEGTFLEFTNIKVERKIEADQLVAEGKSHLDLSGTSTPLLIDTIADNEDAWGAGVLLLGLDNFDYGRLAKPSGQAGDAAGEIRKWRRVWLARRYDERSARPARHLAGVLREQGLFEASRRVLLDAFAAEGMARPTFFGRWLSQMFGLLFGHGLSGTRTLVTLGALWLYGAYTIADFDARGMLVADQQSSPKEGVACGSRIDPLVYAADAMIPLVDLGEEKKCHIDKASGVSLQPGFRWGRWSLFGELAIARFFWAFYCMMGWIAVSLAIATWSGLFKRGGRE